MLRLLFLILVLVSPVTFVSAKNSAPIFLFNVTSPFDKISMKASDDDVLARLDALKSSLSNDKSSRVCFINYGTKTQIKRRERQLKKALSYLKIDVSRTTILTSQKYKDIKETIVWIVPEGADLPTP